MADFCKQCGADMFPPGTPGDLAGLSTEADTAAGRYPVVLCEGCGPIQVDHEGRCVSLDCLKGGHLDRLGDAPVDAEYHAKMVAVMQRIDELFNNGVKGPARKNG